MKKQKKRSPPRYDPLSVLFALGVIAADIFLWYRIVAGAIGASGSDSARIFFLDVGQGDAELLMLPGGVTIMTDAGPDTKILQSLGKVLPQGDTYIDVAIISHPERDHFGGYNYLLDHYRVGVFVYNGRDAAPGEAAWQQLRAKIKEKNIPLITIGKGDSIRYGTAGNRDEIAILSPSIDFDQSAALNDSGIVELVKTPGLRALLVADTGFNVEDALVAEAGAAGSDHVDLHADVLKIPHHGSKYASNDAFLRAVAPKLAVIEVAAKNSFGQPASSTLARIASSTRAAVFRTDKDGTIEVVAQKGKIIVSKEK